MENTYPKVVQIKYSDKPHAVSGGRDSSIRIQEIFTPKRSSERDVVNITGRGGAALFLEKFYGRPLTLRERSELHPGTYTISSAKGLQYNGMFDHKVADGYKIAKRINGYFIEYWRGGQREKWHRIPRKRFLRLKYAH